MVKFTIDQLRQVMDNPENIRNISVIAHVDHGKSTLTDSLVRKAGIIADESTGDVKWTQTRDDEKTRGITIKSTGVSLYNELVDPETNVASSYLINLIDSPGHVDFSSEVTSALRVTDGAIVVVDYVEGVSVQTETVLRQALQEMIKPVLIVNKMDRAFFELKHDPETIYQNLVRIIENANVIISTYQKTEMGDLQVSPLEGTVAFGSAFHGWGFTLNTFSKLLSKKTKIPQNKIIQKLWGNNFYNEKTNKWEENETEGDNQETLKRGFNLHILEPIMKLATSIDKREKEIYSDYMKKLEIQIDNGDLIEAESKSTKILMRKIMHNWIDIADALLEMVVLHLPSPKSAQKYRTGYLYEGSLEDDVARSMIACDPEGPVMVFVSKMVPNADYTRFLAFGRVFSGTVRSGQKVRILGPNFEVGKSTDLFEKTINKVVIWMGNKIEEVDSIPCGNTCAIGGIDQCLVKQGTLTDHPVTSKIRAMKYSVSPVVRVSVMPKNSHELPKLLDGISKLVKSDQLVQAINTETEHIIAGSGELHLEICLNDLRTVYTNNIEIITTDPIVPFKETVTLPSSQVCVAKSANKHNRLFVSAEPLSEELISDIESGVVSSKEDMKLLSRKLIDNYGWNQHDAKKLWVFGTDGNPTNVLVDQCQGVQYINEIRDKIETGFNWVTAEGILANENMRGIRFNIVDTLVHSDPAHRGTGQIMPMARRSFLASQYTAQPRFQEPVYKVDISAPNFVADSIYQTMSQRRGMVISEDPVSGTPLINYKCYLPVAESFGFTKHLRAATSGHAFPQCSFDHWEVINQDPFDGKSQAFKIMMDIRKRKGLQMEIPILSDYLDKI